jgi:ferredoxin-NADP reductase
VALLLSARHWNDILRREELLELARDGSSFDLSLALTREQPRRAGDYNRRIDPDMMAEIIGRMPGGPTAVFVCGSNAFANAAADAAVAAGVASATVHTERYGN